MFARKPAVLAGMLLPFVAVSAAEAHDTGFGHSRRAILVGRDAEGWILEYRTVLAPEEALLEMTQMDRDGDGRISPQERDVYFDGRGAEIGRGLRIRTPDGAPQAVELRGWALQHNFAQVYRFALSSRAEELLLEDHNFPHKPGMVRVRPGKGVKIELARPVDLFHAERITLRIVREPD